MSMPADEPQTPWVDPIVAEVRAARERIVAAVGGDIHLLCEQLRARQAAADPSALQEILSAPNETGCRPNGPGEHSPGLRPKADALGSRAPPPGGLKGRESLQSHT